MSAPNLRETLTRIEEALALGRKIDAIKLYRRYTGVGLAEAKAAVERLEAELRAASPERFATSRPDGASPQSRWCGWGFLAFGTLFVLVGLGKGLSSLSLSFGTARIKGTVVEMRERGIDSDAREPVVEYHIGGTKYRCTGIGSALSPYAAGDKVWVVYKVGQPETALIESFFDRWLMPLMIGGIGMAFAAVGVSIAGRNRVRAAEQGAAADRPRE